MRDLRFGVSDGDRFSHYWKVRAAAGRPELVVMSNRLGGFVHLTMHEDPAHWHFKATLPTGPIVRPWVPPTELQPGIRRLIRLEFPAEAVRYPRPKGSGRVAWFAAPDAETWVEFTIILCAHGRPTILNADFVGAVQLADGSEALVIHRQASARPASWTFHAPDPEEAKRLMRRPGMGMLIHGTDPDGCLWLLHLYSTPRDQG